MLSFDFSRVGAAQLNQAMFRLGAEHVESHILPVNIWRLVLANVGAKHYIPCVSRVFAASILLQTPVVRAVFSDRILEYSIRHGVAVSILEEMPERRAIKEALLSRKDFGAVVIGEAMYMFGGINRQGTVLSSVAKINFTEWICTTVPDMPSGRRGATGLSVQGSIYVIGGRNNTHLNLVERFDVQAETWKQIPSLNLSRTYCAATFVANAIWVLGGCNSLYVERLDLNVPCSWDLISPLPHMSGPRKVGCAMAAVGQTIYVFGGWNIANSVGQEVVKLDLDSMEWVQSTRAPVVHNYFPQPVTMPDGSIYLFGGSPDGAVSKFEATGEVWRTLPGIGADKDGGGCYAAYLVVPESGSQSVPFAEGSVTQLVEHVEPPAQSVPFAEGSVIQLVEHVEPPAHIDEKEAAVVVALQHAGFVERNLGAMASVDVTAAEGDDGDPEEEILLSKINRNTKLLRHAFLQGPSLRPCRDALEAAGHPCKLVSGALIFVRPMQYRHALKALSNIELHPNHIVFTNSLEYLVEETLDSCKACCNAGCRSLDLRTASEVATASDVLPLAVRLTSQTRITAKATSLVTNLWLSELSS